MPSSCVVKGCKNYDTKAKREHGISYHRFPTDPRRREIWFRIISKERKEVYFEIYKNTRVCSAHFCEDDFFYTESGLKKLKSTAVPRFVFEVPIHCVTQPQSVEDSQNEEEIVKTEEKIISNCPTEKFSIAVSSSVTEAYRKKITTLENRQIKSIKKIKLLRKQNGRLKKKNQLLQDIIKELKQKTSSSSNLSPL